MKHESRTNRWSKAVGAALEAVSDLIDIQAEYQDWRDNLPENLSSSAVAEKLDYLIELDLGGVQSTLEEAEGADMPLGFGRD